MLTSAKAVGLLLGLTVQFVPGSCSFGIDKTLLDRSAGLSCSEDSYVVVPDNGSGVWPYREYKSSNATPPVFNITQNGEELASGLIFLDIEDVGDPAENQQRALIMTSKGDLVWAGLQGMTSNFHMQTFNGKSVITLWNGTGAGAVQGMDSHGAGTVLILNDKYETIYNVCPKVDIYFPPGQEQPCAADVHESIISPQNTIFVTMYNTTQADLTVVGGPKDGWVLDPLAVEVDIETNEPLFIWSPLAHVPINTTHASLQTTGRNSSDPFDWFHTNSIQPYNGNVFVNSRQTWRSYMVDKSSGHVMWTIDGETGGDFGSLPSGGNFSWQHHARIFDHGNNQVLITYFNDANGFPSTDNPSVGLGLIVDLPPSKNKSTVLYSHLVDSSQQISSFAEGSYQMLPNGNAFLGYGVKSGLKEFGPKPLIGGDIRWSAEFGYITGNHTAQSYRAFKQDWSATPRTEIDLVVLKAKSNDTLDHCAQGSEWRGFVSWNGATNVTDYAVYVGSSSDAMKQVGMFAKKGFETEFVVPKNATFVQVTALEGQSSDAAGKSAVVAVK